MQKQKNQKQIVYADVAIHDMPLRSLLYIGRTYEQLVPVRERYRKEMVKLPMPEFYTFYNGTEKLKQQCENLFQCFQIGDPYFIYEIVAVYDLHKIYDNNEGIYPNIKLC